MLDMKRILCPTDLSENSRKAVALTLSLASKYEAHAFFMHVTDRPSRDAYDEHASAALEMEAIEDEERRVRDDVRGAMESLMEGGMAEVPSERLAYRVASGGIADEIIRASEEAQVDVIVMGSHGRTTIKDFLLGSAAERVVKKATCAVLVVKPEGFPYLRD
jgi:universal stress protein A